MGVVWESGGCDGPSSETLSVLQAPTTEQTLGPLKKGQYDLCDNSSFQNCQRQANESVTWALIKRGFNRSRTASSTLSANWVAEALWRGELTVQKPACPVGHLYGTPPGDGKPDEGTPTVLLQLQ